VTVSWGGSRVEEGLRQEEQESKSWTMTPLSGSRSEAALVQVLMTDRMRRRARGTAVPVDTEKHLGVLSSMGPGEEEDITTPSSTSCGELCCAVVIHSAGPEASEERWGG
jgi:hypothetical protein